MLLELAETAPETAIWVTGHSLGGALSTVAAARLMERIENDPAYASLNLEGMATFGSPRVGDEDFTIQFNTTAERLGVQVWRFVHGDDIVPRIPLEWQGFDHVGLPVYLSLDDEDVCDDFGKEAPCLLYLPDQTEWMDSFWEGWLAGGSVGDHDYIAYHEGILGSFDDPELADIVGCP
jgi:pimeloyl-ACP methyl ester carboxylesterase